MIKNMDVETNLLKNKHKSITSWVDLTRLFTSIMASIAIPIVIFFVGKNIESTLKAKELEAKYVEIAVGILTQPPSLGTENLRNWAIENINEYAEIKFSEEAVDELKNESLPTIGKTFENTAPNYTISTSPRNIEYIVITDTQEATMNSALRVFNDPSYRTSYHYLIGTGGEIERLVSEEHIAWHAGKSTWEGNQNLNRYSIGIGMIHLSSNWLDLTEGHPAINPEYTTEQLDALVILLKDILERRELTVEAVITKEDITQGRFETDLSGAQLEIIKSRLR